jgi:hypothetical protein
MKNKLIFSETTTFATIAILDALAIYIFPARKAK